MKTIVFNEKLYAVRGFEELTGKDWVQLANCLEAVADIGISEERINEVIELLIPELLEAATWSPYERHAFFLAICAVPLQTIQWATFERVSKALRRMDRAQFKRHFIQAAGPPG